MTSITMLSATFLIGLTGVLAPGESPTLDEHRVLYAGHPDNQQAMLELSATRDEAFISVNGAQVMTLEAAVSRFEPGVCVDDSGVMLAMAASGAAGFELIIWGEGEGISRVGLNHQAASAVRAARRDGACSFALLDVSGALHVITPSKHEHAIATGFVAEVSAREELTMGLSLEHSPEWILATDMVNRISILEFEDRSVRQVELDKPAVGRMLLNGKGAWVSSSSGVLWWVPRGEGAGEPRAVVRSNSSTTSGLTVWRPTHDEEPMLAWVGLDGVVHLYDGEHRRIKISHAPVRWPLLEADLLERGAPQLIALGDDGVLTVLEKQGDSIGWHREDVGLRPLAPGKLSPGIGGEPSRLLVSSGALATHAHVLGHSGAIPLHRSMRSWWERGAAPLAYDERAQSGKVPGVEEEDRSLDAATPGTLPDENLDAPVVVGCQAVTNGMSIPHGFAGWLSLLMALLAIKRVRSGRGEDL